MPAFLSRTFSLKSRKESSKTQDSNVAPSSPSRFKMLTSRSGSRPPSSSSAVDGGTASRVKSLLTRTPTASRTGSRGGGGQSEDALACAGENNGGHAVTSRTAIAAAGKPPLPHTGGGVGPGVHDHHNHTQPVSLSGNSKLGSSNQLPPHAPIRRPSPQRVNSPLNSQRGLLQANRQTNSPFPAPSRTPQQDYQQQLRRSTASPPISFRGPSRGPSPYNGPYPTIQNHTQWPPSFNAIDNAENFNVVDFNSRQGTPKLRSPSRNSYRNYTRSQSMTSDVEPNSPLAIEGGENFTPHIPRSSTSPNLDSSGRKSPQGMRNNNPNIAGVMMGNRGPGGMGSGMNMSGFDGGMNLGMHAGNPPRRGDPNIPPMPRIPSMYSKPSAQSVRNQNQMMRSNNHSQYPPPFRNGRPRNSYGPEGYPPPQPLNLDDPSQYPMGGLPPRIRSPFQPPPRPHSTGPRGSNMIPPPHRRSRSRTSEIPNNYPNADAPLPEGRFSPDSKIKAEQPTIPTALPTPSLTPTPPSRSNSNEERQTSDDESGQEDSQVESKRNIVPAEAQPSRWQDNGQNHGYFRRHPQHSNSPPSPISAPATPITASSASSTHGNPPNHVILQQIQVAAPIMPGPVKENCYTKDISLVMEQCMMGHGRRGGDSVMRRTANWQHRVGCMMCGDYGCPSTGDKAQSAPSTAGNQWLWLCSWCALRVCSDCRCRLGEEEDALMKKKGGSATTLKVDLIALRSKIIEEKKLEHEMKAEETIEDSSEDTAQESVEVPESEEEEKQKVNIAADIKAPEPQVAKPASKTRAQKSLGDPTKKVDVVRENKVTPIEQIKPFTSEPEMGHVKAMKPPRKVAHRPTPPLSTGSKESVNSFATAGSHVPEPDLKPKAPRVATETINTQPEHPPRVSSRNPSTKVDSESNIPKKEAVAPSMPAAMSTEIKKAEEPSVPVEAVTKNTIKRLTKTKVIVSSPVVDSPKTPESSARNPLPVNATVASVALQAAVAAAPKMDTMVSVSPTIIPPVRSDSSLRSVVSPEMLALITGIPAAEQPKSKSSTSSAVTKPLPSTRDLGASPIPPAVPPKSPSRADTASPPPPPPKSSSSALLAPLVHAKSSIPSSSPPPLSQSTARRSAPLAPPSSLPTTEKFVLPPLSFESEIANEIDNIFGTREYKAPKAQATHTEEAYRQQTTVESSPKGGRRWFKGLFGGKK